VSPFTGFRWEPDEGVEAEGDVGCAPVHRHPVCRKHHPDFGKLGASDGCDELTHAPEFTSVVDKRAFSVREDVSSV
jgi:hypothetical protein